MWDAQCFGDTHRNACRISGTAAALCLQLLPPRRIEDEIEIEWVVFLKRILGTVVRRVKLNPIEVKDLVKKI